MQISSRFTLAVHIFACIAGKRIFGIIASEVGGFQIVVNIFSSDFFRIVKISLIKCWFYIWPVGENMIDKCSNYWRFNEQFE